MDIDIVCGYLGLEFFKIKEKDSFLDLGIIINFK